MPFERETHDIPAPTSETPELVGGFAHVCIATVERASAIVWSGDGWTDNYQAASPAGSSPSPAGSAPGPAERNSPAIAGLVVGIIGVVIPLVRFFISIVATVAIELAEQQLEEDPFALSASLGRVNAVPLTPATR